MAQITAPTPLAQHPRPPIDDQGAGEPLPPLTWWQRVQIGAAILIVCAACVSPVSFDRPDPVLEQAKKDRAALKDLLRAYQHQHSENMAMRAELDRLGKAAR